jgi:hypothetical protein
MATGDPAPAPGAICRYWQQKPVGTSQARRADQRLAGQTALVPEGKWMTTMNDSAQRYRGSDAEARMADSLILGPDAGLWVKS